MFEKIQEVFLLNDYRLTKAIQAKEALKNLVWFLQNDYHLGHLNGKLIIIKVYDKQTYIWFTFGIIEKFGIVPVKLHS